MRSFSNIVFLSASLWLTSSSSNIALTTTTSPDHYLCTTVSWGTPAQSFKVLVDTTDHSSWIYSSDANTPEDTFDADASTTYSSSSKGHITFDYQGSSTVIDYANDTLTIDGNSMDHILFGLARTNFTVADNEGVSGFLSLDRDSTIVSAMADEGLIDSEAITIDVGRNTVHFGDYSPSGDDVDATSNDTFCSSTTNGLLSSAWVFDVELWTDGQPRLDTQSIRGVIDAASPFITVFSSSSPGIDEIWKYIDNSYVDSAANCNYSTRECSSAKSLWDSMTFLLSDSGFNVTIESAAAMDGDSILFLYDDDANYTTDCDYVLFLGRPFLDGLVVTLSPSNSSATFSSSSSSSSSSLDWETIGIVAGCVVLFAFLFFAVYCWKYGKIPPPTTSDVEEQELPAVSGPNSNANASANYSLLRGPAQAVGQSVNAVPVGSGGPYSGLDEDENYQRQSAIEEQQRRERELREENERRQREEERAMAQHSQSSAPQRLGGHKKTGNCGGTPRQTTGRVGEAAAGR